MVHPYQDLPSKNFFKSLSYDNYISELFEPRFKISAQDKIATAGSCFAQNLSNYVLNQDSRYLSYENHPMVCSKDCALNYGFNQYSCNYGNIYSPTQLYQLLNEAATNKPRFLFTKNQNQKFIDLLRPSGQAFSTIDALKLNRLKHLKSVKMLLENATVWIFTLGLTETWFYKTIHNALPVHPGIFSNESFDDSVFFKNLSYQNSLQSLMTVMELVRDFQPKAKFIFTVSPIPLNATYEHRNVLVSTYASKSILRAVCDYLSNNYTFAEYFPSFEIVTTHLNKKNPPFSSANPRQISNEMIQFVMSYFAKIYGLAQGSFLLNKTFKESIDDVVCEEALYNSSI